MKKILQVAMILISGIASIIAVQFFVKQLYQHRKSKYVDLQWDFPRKPWEE